MKRRDFLVLAAGSTLAGCGATPGPEASAAPPAREAGALMSRPANLALVLGGGGCRGYGHLGVIRALERSGIRPDLVVGSSAGSVVGALFASGMTFAQLEEIGDQLSPDLLRDLVLPRLGFFGGGGIARLVRAHAGERDIASLPTRFAAVATDLYNGEAVILQQGELGRAVQASSTAPGLLEPVRWHGRLLVDGNLSAPVPVRIARRLGARAVIAVDVSFPPDQADIGGPFDALYQGFSILTRRLAIEERATADVMLAPDLPKHNDMSRETLKSLIDAGEKATLASMPAIRALVRARST